MVGPLLDVFFGVSVVGAWLVVLGGLYLNESYLTVFTEATKVLQVIRPDVPAALSFSSQGWLVNNAHHL